MVWGAIVLGAVFWGQMSRGSFLGAVSWGATGTESVGNGLYKETFFANKEIVNNVHYKLIIRADDLANSMSTGMASKTKLALHNDCIIVSIC